MKSYLLPHGLFISLCMLIVGCSPQNTTPDPTATPSDVIISDLGGTGVRSTAIPLTVDVAWQPAQQPIHSSNITQVQRIGIIQPPQPLSTAFFQTFSRDGSLLILLNDSYLLGYDLNNGELRFNNTRQNLVFVYVSPEYPELYGITASGYIVSLDSQTGRIISEFEAHPRFADVADYAIDSGILALGGTDGTLSIWDAHNNQLLQQINAHIGKVTHIRFSPDGKFILSSGDDFRTIVWDVETGEAIHRIENGSTVTNIALSPDGLSIASSIEDYITIWRLDDEVDKFRYTLNLEDIGLGTVKFSPNSQYLITGGLESEMALWDAESGDLQAVLPDIYSVRTSSSFNPENDLLAISTITNQANVFDITSISPTDETIQSGILEALDRVLSVSFTPDGMRLLLLQTSGNIEVWGIAQ